MGIFSIFKRKVRATSKNSDVARIQAIMDYSEKHDYLGKAAEAGRKAQAAVKAGKLDKAWRHYHEQKKFYGLHASRNNYTNRQVLSLDSQVHEGMANILRLEKKHNDALCHILYWVIASNGKPIKRHDQKIKAYFNRCKYRNTSLKEAKTYSRSKKSLPEFSKAQSKVAEWRQRG